MSLGCRRDPLHERVTQNVLPARKGERYLLHRISHTSICGIFCTIWGLLVKHSSLTTARFELNFRRAIRLIRSPRTFLVSGSNWYGGRLANEQWKAFRTSSRNLALAFNYRSFCDLSHLAALSASTVIGCRMGWRKTFEMLSLPPKTGLGRFNRGERRA